MQQLSTPALTLTLCCFASCNGAQALEPQALLILAEGTPIICSTIINDEKPSFATQEEKDAACAEKIRLQALLKQNAPEQQQPVVTIVPKNYNEPRLIAKQERLLKLHELSTKILLESNPVQKEQFKLEQRKLLDDRTLDD